MMKKKVFYLSVNGNDSPSTLEILDILNKNEMEIVIAHELRTVREFIKILSRRDNILSVFSISDYLVSIDDEYSKTSFQQTFSYIQQRIQDVSTLDIFYAWLSQFSKQQIQVDIKPAEEIMSMYNLNIRDVVDELEDWKEQYDQRVQSINEEFTNLQFRMDTIFENQCSVNDMTPFVIRKIRISVFIPFEHSLSYYFNIVRLSQNWIIAFYRDMIRTSLIDKIDQEEFNNVMMDRDRETLIIYHEDFEQFITLGYSSENPLMLELTLDIRPYEDVDIIRKQVQSILDIETTDTYKTRSVSGSLYLKNVSYDKLVLHDFIMNDGIANRYFYLNELEKCTRFGENVTIHFENSITAILVNSKNDTVPKPPSLAYFRGNYVRVNITKASGSQNDLDNVTRFQNLLCATFQRFLNTYQNYHPLYLEFFPSIIFAKLGKPQVGEEEQDITNFADKYKNIFKKTGYKTSCRPKSRVPTIITEEEAKSINPLKVIKFPKDGDDTIGIPQEYLTCRDPEYAFPGITSLSGGALSVPCCFNKNPRSSKAYLEYYKGEKITEPKGTEHVKSEHQIIKTFGDVGKLPSAIHQFLIALMPDKVFYRVGTEDSPTTLLHSLNFLKDGDKKTDMELRKELITFFGKNLNVCKQENWSLTIDDILNNIEDDNLYLDPRKYIRLLEVFFDVNIIVLTKSKKTEELQLLVPDHVQFYTRYQFMAEKSFVFLYEHWGTSPDRYTKRLHPVCEMIISEGQKLYSLDDSIVQDLNVFYRSVFRLFPIQQNCPVVPPALQYRSQIIDSWGKCRGFVCDLDEDRSIYLESVVPIAPIYIPNEDKFPNKSINVPSLEYLMTKLRGMQVVKMVSFLETKYIQFQYQSHEWKAQVLSKTNDQFETITYPFLSYSPRTGVERVLNIAKERQLARIVLDYTLYLYSVNYIKSIDFDAFFEKHTVIRSSYDYPKVLSERILENPRIMENDVLIIPSKEVREKLEFNIRYYLLYKYQELENYKNYKILPNFWQSPYDFTQWKQTFYVGVFERLMRRQPYLAIDNDELVNLRKNEGYWFQKNEIPIPNLPNPYRYVKVDSQEKAIALTIFWNRYKYIPNIHVSIPDDPPLTYISIWDNTSHEWLPKPQELVDGIQVLITHNENQEMYVLLEIKN